MPFKNNANTPFELAKEWGILEIEEFDSTGTAELFKGVLASSGAEVILKVFTKVGQRDEGGGSIFIEANSDCCVPIYRHDERAQLIEFLSGQNLYQFSEKNQERRATAIFIDLFQKVCNTWGQQRNGCSQVSDLYQALERVGDIPELSSHLEKARELAAKLERTKGKELLLHGDLHHENIIQNSRGEFKIIDPKGLYGEPHYELATFLKNPWDYPGISHSAQIFEERLSTLCQELCLERERVVAYCYVHLVLSICWSLESGGEYSHQRAVLDIVKNYL